ncbi:MAG: hypothetical protein JO086_03170, partial [Acidimicrobiia bacterium]|nr:hypothetical protein [Acidimicrobiia bacterium]
MELQDRESRGRQPVDALTILGSIELADVPDAPIKLDNDARPEVAVHAADPAFVAEVDLALGLRQTVVAQEVAEAGLELARRGDIARHSLGQDRPHRSRTWSAATGKLAPHPPEPLRRREPRRQCVVRGTFRPLVGLTSGQHKQHTLDAWHGHALDPANVTRRQRARFVQLAGGETV